MRRTLPGSCFRLVLHSCKSSTCEALQNYGAAQMDFPRAFTSLDGYNNFRLGEPSVTRSLQVRIIDALRFRERQKASNLLFHLGRVCETSRAEDFLFILEYCARSPDPLFVMETWRVMEEKKIDINRECCHFIICALSKGGYLEEALSWLKFLGENRHIKPKLSTYNIFLNGCSKQQSSIHVDHCLQLMEGWYMGKSEVTYMELLKVAVWQRNLSAVNVIWKELTRYYSPNIISLRILIQSFTRLGDLGSAYEALQHMVALVLHGNPSVKRSAESIFHPSRLDIPIPINNDLCLDNGFVKYMEETSSGHNFVDTSNVEAQYISGIENPNSNGYSVNHGHIPNVSEFIFSSRTGNPSAPEGGQSCKKLAFLFSKGRKKRFSNSVLKLLRNSFSDLIYTCAELRNRKLAEQLFLQMRKLRLNPSLWTYNNFLRAVILESDVTQTTEVVKEMKIRRMMPDSAILATLSVGYSRILELDTAETMLDQIVVGSPKILHAFNALLSACDVMDEAERAIQVLAKMKHLKLQPNIQTYELMFSLFGTVNAPYERGDQLSQAHVSERIRVIEMDMTKNKVAHSHVSMENLLKALGAEGMISEMFQYIDMAECGLSQTEIYPGTVMYNILLHALAKAKKTDLAISVFQKMKYSDIPPDVATYDIMIDCCSIANSLKSAWQLVAMMMCDGFYPQTSTYSSLIKILLKKGSFDEALNLLNKVSDEGIQSDAILLNTFLKQAYTEHRIDVIENIIERMHLERIQPDPATCSFVFCAYVRAGFIDTAMEALQVLSLRMLSEDDRVLEEKKTAFQHLIVDEDPEAEARIFEIFRDKGEYLATALLYLRWCEISGYPVSWSPNESPWARRLSSLV